MPEVGSLQEEEGERKAVTLSSYLGVGLTPLPSHMSTVVLLIMLVLLLDDEQPKGALWSM